MRILRIIGAVSLSALVAFGAVLVADAIQLSQYNIWRAEGQDLYKWGISESLPEAKPNWIAIALQDPSWKNAVESIDLTEQQVHGAPQWLADYSVTLPDASPIIDAVSKGEAAAAPEQFVIDLIGVVYIRGESGLWSIPNLTHHPNQKTTAIQIAEEMPANTKASVTIGVLQSPVADLNRGSQDWTVRISAPDISIAAITGTSPYDESMHSVTLDSLGASGTASVTFDANTQIAGTETGLEAYPRIGSILQSIWLAFLPVAAWVILLLAGLTGKLRTSRRVKLSNTLVAALLALYFLNTAYACAN